MMTQHRGQFILFQKGQKWLIKTSSNLLLSHLFTLFAFSMDDIVLIFTQNVVIVSSWGKDREDNTESMLIDTH